MASKKGKQEKKVARFVGKLWDALRDYPDLLSWNSDGKSFIIHDERRLVEEVFNNIVPGSFHRNLNLYNFAKNGNVVYHKKFYFIRDQTDDFELLKEIKRSKDSRQCNADTPTDQMDGLTSSDFSDQGRLTMVSESSDYFSEGCSSQSRQVPQQWEDDTIMDPLYGTAETGPVLSSDMMLSQPSPAPLAIQPRVASALDIAAGFTQPIQDDSFQAGIIGCSSQSRQVLQQWENGIIMDPMCGPVEGGTPFKIKLSSVLEFEHLEATFVGIPGSETVVHRGGNIWLGLTPKGNEPGPVQVVFKTPNGFEIGTACFIYYDDNYLCSTVFQLPFNSDMDEHQGNSGAGAGNNSGNSNAFGAGNNSDNSNAFGWSSQGRGRQAVDVLRWALYTAARNGFRQFIRLLFGTFAGRIIFETYKNKTPLPEDIADANGHSEIAVFLRDVTERFSTEGESCPAQSKVINWSELVRAVKEIDSDHYEGEEKLWKDESLEKPYFADVSSSDSDKENTDSDEELKRAVFKESKRCDEKEQQVPNHLLKSKLCGDESDEPDDPLLELTKRSLEDGQELREAFSKAKQEGKWKQDSQREEKEQTKRTNFPKSDKSGEPVVPEPTTLSLEDGQETTSDPRNAEVTEMQLADISEDVGTCWRELGPKLEIAASKIHNLDEECRNNWEKANSLLLIWKQQEGRCATVARLANYLESIKRKSIAEKLRGIRDIQLPIVSTASQDVIISLTLECTLNADPDTEYQLKCRSAPVLGWGKSPNAFGRRFMLCTDAQGNKYMLKACHNSGGDWNSEEIQKNRQFLKTVATARQEMGKRAEERRQESLKRISTEVQELRRQLKPVKLDSCNTESGLESVFSDPSESKESSKEPQDDANKVSHQDAANVLQSCKEQRTFCQGIYNALIKLIGEIGQPRDDNFKCIKELYEFTKELKDREKRCFSKIQQLCGQKPQLDERQVIQVKELERWSRTQEARIEGVENLLSSLFTQGQNQYQLKCRSAPVLGWGKSPNAFGRRRSKTDASKNPKSQSLSELGDAIFFSEEQNRLIQESQISESK